MLGRNLIIEVTITTHLIRFLNFLGLFMALKPSDIFLMKPPTLIFELLRSIIPVINYDLEQGRLLNRLLLIVEHEEQSINVASSYEVGIDDSWMG